MEPVDAAIRHLAAQAAVDAARAAGRNALPAADLDRFHQRYLQIAGDGDAQNPADTSAGHLRQGRRRQSKARNLLRRLRDHPDSILAFMRDFSVPFDNNLSERDLRMIKLRQKISGAFRSFAALLDFCRTCPRSGRRVRGYVATARKNGLNALDALRRVFMGNPFIPAINTS